MSRPHPPAVKPTSALVTFLIVATGSILFASKGVVIKLGYEAGSDALEILTLRMLFAAPLFLVMGCIGHVRETNRMTWKDWGQVAWLGFIGYYLSALLNFAGLTYISVGLERMLLFTYPTIVLAITAFVLKKRVTPTAWLAAATVWAGIAVAFAGENQQDAPHAIPGALLVLCSACTYATYVVMSAPVVQRLGIWRFTGWTGLSSAIYSAGQYAVVREPERLAQLPPVLYQYGLILALFGTLLPMALLAAGLKRAGAAKFSIISAVGPVATVVLAAWVLGEQMNVWQICGLVLTLSGGVLVSLLKGKTP